VPGEVVSVGFYPREGPATSNYRCTAGTLRFLPGTQAQQIAVQILTNSQSSGFTMHLVLTSPMGAGAVLGQYPVFSRGVVRGRRSERATASPVRPSEPWIEEKSHDTEPCRGHPLFLREQTTQPPG